MAKLLLGTALLVALAVPVRAADTIVGDCDGDGIVTVADLITGVQFLLGSNDRCAALECDRTLAVTLPPTPPIVCLMEAVGNALAQPCAGSETVSNGRVVCKPTTP